MPASRRDFLRSAAAVSLGFTGLQLLLQRGRPLYAASATAGPGYGPLLPDPQGVLDLPAGFSYRIIGRTGQEMSDGLLRPGKPDGMAAFAGQAGRVVLICNHELESEWTKLGPFGKDNERATRLDPAAFYDPGDGKARCQGGTTTLIYDPASGEVERSFLSLAGTSYNCAGGPTPWGTWISCEETTVRAGSKGAARDHGYSFEVPAQAEGPVLNPAPLKAMGRFRHEAIAVDPRSGVVYLTEDLGDGCIYRFIPNQPGQLAAGGRLQALAVRDRPSLDTRNWPKGESPADHLVAVGRPLEAAWIDLDDVEAPLDDLRIRAFSAGAARFARGEGMWYGNDAVYFCCTNGGALKAGQVWRYVPSRHEGTPGEAEHPARLELFIEPNDTELLENGDNITVAPWGDLVLCEDGEGIQHLVGVTPAGELYKLGRTRLERDEFAGATFSPDGRTLFVNLQGRGWTFAITGPWRA